MVLLGKEQPTGIETQEVFNPTTASMVLQAQQAYIQALREDYLRTQEAIKEFKKEYGGFYSPFDKDNQSWYNITSRPIQEVMAKYGPDAIRSQEGRAAITQAINNVDYGALAKLRASAKIGETYRQKEAELRSKGLYSEEFQNWANQQRGLPGMSEWDTLKYGVPSQTSPDIYNSLNAATSEWFDNAEPLYKGMEGGNRVYELNMQDLKNIANSQVQGFIKTPRGAYELHQIKQRVKAANPYMSDEQIDAASIDALNTAVAEANRERLKPKEYKADEFVLADRKHELDIDTWNRTTGRDKDDKHYQNIFRDADANGYSSVNYSVEDSGKLRISPLSSKGIRVHEKDGKVQYYSMTGRRAMEVISPIASVDDKKRMPTPLRKLDPTATYYFIPGGQMKARNFVNRKDKYSYNKYYIQGTVAQKVPALDSNGNVILNQDGTPSMTRKFVKDRNGATAEVYMEVRENPHAYRKEDVVR